MAKRLSLARDASRLLLRVTCGHSVTVYMLALDCGAVRVCAACASPIPSHMVLSLATLRPPIASAPSDTHMTCMFSRLVCRCVSTALVDRLVTEYSVLKHLSFSLDFGGFRAHMRHIMT